MFVSRTGRLCVMSLYGKLLFICNLFSWLYFCIIGFLFIAYAVFVCLLSLGYLFVLQISRTIQPHIVFFVCSTAQLCRLRYQAMFSLTECTAKAALLTRRHSRRLYSTFLLVRTQDFGNVMFTGWWTCHLPEQILIPLEMRPVPITYTLGYRGTSFFFYFIVSLYPFGISVQLFLFVMRIGHHTDIEIVSISVLQTGFILYMVTWLSIGVFAAHLLMRMNAVV